MIEPLFWNPLPAAAVWLTQRTGRAFDARTLVDTVAQMGEAGNPTPTCIKATLPRELTYATISIRGLHRIKANITPELETQIQALNKKFGLPTSMDYVEAAYPTTVPLAVNQLLDLLVYGQKDLAVLLNTDIERRKEFAAHMASEFGLVVPVTQDNPEGMVWVMPWGKTHRATLETCGINRADLLALGEKLTLPAQNTTKPAPVVAREVRSGNVLTLPNGHTHVPAGQLPLLIADAQWPDDGTDDEGWEINHATCEIESEAEIKEAVQSGALPVKKSTTYAPQTFLQGNAWKTGLVTIADLRAYVAERGMTLTVANAPEPQATTPSPAPVVAETVEQRRARYLAMFETEEKREKRGALQRVADSEGVDRSNMRKDIDKARAARDEQKRAGRWTSQLVQDGKRKG